MADLTSGPKYMCNRVKFPYGVVEASRQLLKTPDEWLLNDAEMERVFRIHQLFYMRDANGNIIRLVARTSDNFYA